MPHKAIYNHKCRQQGTGDVRRLRHESSITPNQRHQDGQCNDPKDDAAAVDPDTTDPFAQVVALGFEHEELVTEVGDGNIQQAGDHRSNDITVGNQGAKNFCEEGERTVTEQGIPRSDQQVSPELAGRDVTRQVRLPLADRVCEQHKVRAVGTKRQSILRPPLSIVQ